jgi:hypothetical protein
VRNAALVEIARCHGALVADVHAHFLGHGAGVGDPARLLPGKGFSERDLSVGYATDGGAGDSVAYVMRSAAGLSEQNWRR